MHVGLSQRAFHVDKGVPMSLFFGKLSTLKADLYYSDSVTDRRTELDRFVEFIVGLLQSLWVLKTIHRQKSRCRCSAMTVIEKSEKIYKLVVSSENV